MLNFYSGSQSLFGWIILLSAMIIHDNGLTVTRPPNANSAAYTAARIAQTPPVAVQDSIKLFVDISANGNVLTNDTDPEGDALTASLVTAPVNGTIVLNANGSFTYTPNNGYTGLDSLLYQVCDNGTPSLCDTATVIFKIMKINTPPLVLPDNITVTEDVPAVGNVLTNDLDLEGDALTVSLVTAPVNGTVVLNADGSFTYTPNANYHGLDSLAYQACDNGAPSYCDIAKVFFNVTSVNDAPIAIRDNITVTEDVPATGNVLTNDSDPDGNALTASLVTAPVNGTVVLNADGSLTYTPNANYNGLDSLIYQVCDNGTPSLCDTATVIFSIGAVNDAPIAIRDNINVTEDIPATGNVLTNDSDPEGDALTASLVTAPVNGTVVLNADGSFTYTPNANYHGLDSLIYQVCDNGTPSLCDTATVIFSIGAVNDAPIAIRDNVTVTEDVPATGNVLTNDSDPDGDALTASLVTAPVNGTVVLNADGSFTYTPNANYNGLDSLIYQVCDNGTPSLCDTATVIFNVTSVNDAPIAVRDSVSLLENVPATGNVLTNDSDPDGNVLTASLVTAPVNGTVVLNADGSFTYTPNMNYGGLDSLVYKVCDNGTPSLCDTATLLLKVTGDNDPPLISAPANIAVTEDVPLPLSGITFSDEDAGTASVTVSFTVGAGTLTAASSAGVAVNNSGTNSITLNGSITAINTFIAGNKLAYTPVLNANGTVVLDILIDDNGHTGGPAATANEAVDLVINAVNDAPVINNVPGQSTDQDVPFHFNSANNNQISITDVDALNGSMTVKLTAANGKMTLVTTANITFATGSGTLDQTMTFSGQLADLNNALADVVFTPDEGFAGSAQLRIDVDDEGNTPAPPMQAGLTIPVTVTGIPPVITNVSATTANGTYKVGDEILVTIAFSQPVQVNTTHGTPDLLLETGNTDRKAVYASGTGNKTLTFSYKVQAGDVSADLDYVNPQSLLLNGSTIQTGSNIAATLALPATGGPNSIAGNKDIVIDGIAPVVTSVAVPAANLYKAGAQLEYIVHFSEAVMVDNAGGNVTIPLTVGAATRTLTYVSGTGTSTLLFRYQVQAGDIDADGIQAAPAMVFNGDQLADKAGNPAVPALNNVGAQANIKVDAVLPVVTAGQVFTIPENSPVATVAGTVAATDAGAVLPLQQFTIISNVDPDGDGTPAFLIDPATGIITVNDTGDLDYEKDNSFNLSITVSDGVNTSAAETVRINLSNTPEKPLDISLGNNTIFENNAINAVIGTLSATSAETGETFTYTLVPGTGSADNGAFSIGGDQLMAGQQFNFEEKSSYQIRIRATTSAGEFLEKAFVITVQDVNEAPTIQAIPNQSFCNTTADQTIALAGITAGPESSQTTTVTVSADNAALFTQLSADQTHLRFRFAAGAAGSTNVTVTVKDNGGTDHGGIDQTSYTFTLGVTSMAVPAITSNKGTKVSKGIPVELTATGGVTYAWDNAPGIISGQNTAVLVIRPEQNVTYRVTVANAAGCTATAQIEMEVIEDYKVEGNNLITPNGDGINDRFIIKNIDSYPNNEVKVFDRSGRMIYIKRGYQNEWDATVNGKALEEGTYYYILDFGTGLPKVKGFISIIRDKF
ncbi:Ig-like domain-containing protein [Chitinophaga defluvii]|uniref:Ig-like domain-containing protein n=1 Tax=Chitinophaga defluvii TaxID=3163343 RepID=A0ABV2T4Z7_9BACT